MANGEEEIGPVPAPAARHGGSPRGRPPSWSSIPALLGVLIAVTAVAGAGVGLLANGGGSSGSGAHTVSSSTTSTSPGSAAEVYLSRLRPRGGDWPSAGDAQLDGHDYPYSLLYENVGDAPSIAAVCGSRASCRATSYELGGHFTRFQATLGIETRGASVGYMHWSVVADGTPAEQGVLAPNSPHHSIDVPLAGASNLELQVTVENELVEGTIVWGNARVH